MGTDIRACPLCGGAPGRTRWRGRGATARTCGRCGFTFLAERSEAAAREALETYERIYARAPEEDPLTALSYASVLRELEPHRRSGLIVDVGSGAGAFVAAAARAGWHAVGTEIAESASRIPLPPGASIIVGEGALDGLATGSADVVTLWEVVEHVDDPIGLLRASARVLRPGGVLRLTTPNHASLSRRLLRSRWPRYHIEHTGYFDAASIVRALTAAGLAAPRATTRTFDPFVIASALRGHAADGPADGAAATSIDRGRQGLRRFAKRTRAGRVVRAALERALAATGLGDTLVAWGSGRP